MKYIFCLYLKQCGCFFTIICIYIIIYIYIYIQTYICVYVCIIINNTLNNTVKLALTTTFLKRSHVLNDHAVVLP